MGKQKKAKALTERQKKVLERVINLSSSLLKLNPTSLRRMGDHVLEHGTDHDGGSFVDNLTEEILRVAQDHKDNKS